MTANERKSKGDKDGEREMHLEFNPNLAPKRPRNLFLLLFRESGVARPRPHPTSPQGNTSVRPKAYAAAAPEGQTVSRHITPQSGPCLARAPQDLSPGGIETTGPSSARVSGCSRLSVRRFNRFCAEDLCAGGPVQSSVRGPT